VTGLPRDYFEFFDLPHNLAIDLKDLEKRFYALSRELHPDRFARRSEAEREKALEDSATLNDAYRTLRDPIARALYLLKGEGFDIGEQGSKDVPPELLEEMFELNMAIEEADAPQLDVSLQRFEKMRDALDSELQAKFDEWDSSHTREALSAIRGVLNRRKYITNLIDKTNVPDRV
jgi:molecular chaperone HscB